MLESTRLEGVASAGGRAAEGAVGDRSGAAAGRALSVGVVADPELVERPRRRRFTAEYKLRIVREADGCTRPGEIGALLRREGLYSSLSDGVAASARRGCAGGARAEAAWSARAAARPRSRMQALRRRLERTEAELEKARRVIEVQGNVSALLEELLGPGRERDRRRAAASDDRPDRRRARRRSSGQRRRAGRWAPPAPLSTGAADRRCRRAERRRGRRRRGRCLRPSARPCSPSCTASGSSTARPRRSGRRCWTRAATWPRSARCTGCWRRTAELRERRDQLTHPPYAEAGAARRAAQRGVELGHHQAQGPGEVDLLLPLRDPRRVQPLRGRLDRPAPRARARRRGS